MFTYNYIAAEAGTLRMLPLVPYTNLYEIHCKGMGDDRAALSRKPKTLREQKCRYVTAAHPKHHIAVLVLSRASSYG